jgi:hypothetical protein
MADGRKAGGGTATGIGDLGECAMHGDENHVPGCHNGPRRGVACDTFVGPIVGLPPARLPVL